MLPQSSPHSLNGNTVASVMGFVCVALVPGIATASYFYGWGTITNCLLCCLFGLSFEAIIAKLRKRPIRYYLADNSALLSSLLLAITLPPYSPWWLLLIGMLFAIVVAKQLFGGLGSNPFNPAMVGYVVLLIAFPLQSSIQPLAITYSALPYLSLFDSFAIVLELQSFEHYLPQGYSGATALDVVKHNRGLTLDQLYQQQAIFADASFVAVATEWINLAFLVGGMALLYRGIITWHAPLAFIVVLALCALIGYDNGSSASKGSILFHLFSGATMVGAFFIITDPSSGATSNLGKLIGGALVAILTYAIRAFGQYPDGLAFAVLLMNFAVPFIDYYTQPITYGHKRRNKRNLTELN